MSHLANGYTGSQNLSDTSSQFNAVEFIARQVLNKACTSTLVKIVAVTTSGGVTPVGYVDVQLLVNQIDGAGNKMPHGVVYNLPYLRLQGGASAIILDPVVGDIGLASIASHDISAIKTTKAMANPGSRRRFSMSDGIYSGGVLNATPAHYVQFTGDGIDIVSPGTIKIKAAQIQFEGNVTSTGDTVFVGDIATIGTLKNNDHFVGSGHRHTASGGSGTGGIPL